MKLIITRHGETEENATGVIQGQTHGTLSAKGVAQAKKVGERLKDEKIDVIYSSDLARAKNTAEEIIAHHPHATVVFTESLRERHWGKYQGGDKKLFPREMRDTWLAQSEEGESREQAHDRAKNFLHETLHKHPNDTVLFVSHGHFSAVVMSALFEKDLEEVEKMGRLQNTNVTIFEIDEDKNHKIMCFNCVKHLKSP